MSSFAALLQRRRSLFSIRPYIVLRSSLHDNAALRFSPSRRGCNRASLSRSRYTRATDVCSRAVLSSAGYRHRSRRAHESQLHRGATKKNTRCIFVAFIGHDIALLVALSRRSPQSFSASSSLRLSLSVERIGRPSRFSPRRTSRAIAVAPITNT